MISRIDWNQTLKLSPESGPTNAKTANGSAASSSCDEPDGRDGRPGKQAFGIKTAAHVGETGPEEVARLRLWIRRRCLPTERRTPGDDGLTHFALPNPFAMAPRFSINTVMNETLVSTTLARPDWGLLLAQPFGNEPLQTQDLVTDVPRNLRVRSSIDAEIAWVDKIGRLPHSLRQRAASLAKPPASVTRIKLCDK
ncbi:hypothetical protein PEBR_34455 [Penicillium brasilianum]|uniref:Uncharacterized protein n=1 Tax=Penicillium brasilianum TaxID=104259 RepID=A0A1S9RDN1_PENBI|nr:hypothetical protein PEBR_34455 [Penicillium brasilianum]